MSRPPDSTLLPSFAEGISCKQFIDPMINIADITIDSLLDENSVFKNIPIIKAGQYLYQAGITIQKGFEIKNQLVFLQSIQKGDLALDGFAKRQEAFRNNEPWFYREVERLLVFIARNTDIRKAQLQAALYLDYVAHNVTEEFFYECLDIVDQLLIYDIKHLLDLDTFQRNQANSTNNSNNSALSFNFDPVKCSRLSSLGLLLRVQSFTYGRTAKSDFHVSKLGNYFSDLIHNIQSPT